MVTIDIASPIMFIYYDLRVEIINYKHIINTRAATIIARKGYKIVGDIKRAL